MKARDVVGRRITGVSQSRRWDSTTGQMVVSLDSIQLDNGTSILVVGQDDGIEPYVVGWVNRR